MLDDRIEAGIVAALVKAARANTPLADTACVYFLIGYLHVEYDEEPKP